MEWDRRQFLAASASLISTASASASAMAALGGEGPALGRVTRDGAGFHRDGRPYRIVGTNMWYAAWLGSPAEGGDRARLRAELDHLNLLGVNNVRIMASGHAGPLRGSVAPAFTRPDGTRNDDLYRGLDVAMAEIGKRGMTAVLVLGNFWEWSGGFSTLLYRANGEYVDMNDPDHPWPAFADSSARLYADAEAVTLYRAHADSILTRTNSVNGQPYAEDPAILSWQLANEPRPGGSDGAIDRNRAAYLDWIASTAEMIRSAAPGHLVSLGQEGTQATNGDMGLVREAHEPVDYVTAHIWPNNWGWVDGADLPGTWPAARDLTTAYIAAHEELAQEMGKPLVIEEFGFPRDGEKYDPSVPDTFRREFYGVVFGAAERSWREGGALAGSNFWAWNGEARAAHEDVRFRNGESPYMGDPPHEPQGWYGVFDSDAAMLGQISAHIAARDTIPA